MIKINQDNNSFGFHVETQGGQILMTSLIANSLAEIEVVVKLLKNEKELNLRFERRTNHKGAFLFSVKTSDGSLLGNSEQYNSEAGMENGIKNLKILLASL